MRTLLPTPKPTDRITLKDTQRGWVCVPPSRSYATWTAYVNRWWDACGRLQIPYIKVMPKSRYGDVSMDVYCCDKDLSEGAQRAVQALWREWTAAGTTILTRKTSLDFGAILVHVGPVQKEALAQVADAFVKVVRQHGLTLYEEAQAAAKKIREELIEEQRKKKLERWNAWQAKQVAKWRKHGQYIPPEFLVGVNE